MNNSTRGDIKKEGWVLVFAHASVAMSGAVCCAAQTSVPSLAIVAAVGLQLFTLYAFMTRQAFLSVAYGTVLSFVLTLACWIDVTTDLQFDSSMSANVFVPELTDRAIAVLVVAASVFYASAGYLLARPGSAPVGSGTPCILEGKRIVWILAILGVLLLGLTTPSSLITVSPYSTPESEAASGPISAGFLSFSAAFLLLAALSASVDFRDVSRFERQLLFLVGSAAVVYFRLLRGDRGCFVTWVFASAILWFARSQRTTLAKVGRLSIAGILLFATMEIWGYIRGEAARVGMMGALAQGSEIRVGKLQTDSGELNPMNITLFPQSYWQLLHTVDLQDSGVSLNWSSFKDFPVQRIPLILADYFGLDRPLHVAWRLAQYRTHGGGMFVVAEGYWNGGLAGVMAIVLCLSVLAALWDRGFMGARGLSVGIYYGLVGTSITGLTYGFQGFVRATEIALFLALVLRFVQYNWTIRRGLAAPMQEASPTRRTSFASQAS